MNDCKEGEACSWLESERVHEEGVQQGEWDCSQGVPLRDDPASGYPEGSPLDLDYRAGYRSGYRSYAAEIREERVRVWRNSRRALRGLRPIRTPVEYWSAECDRRGALRDAAYPLHGEHSEEYRLVSRAHEVAQAEYQEACDMARWKLRLGVPNQ